MVKFKLLLSPRYTIEFFGCTKVSGWETYEIEDKTLPQEAYMRITLKEPIDKCKTVAVEGDGNVLEQWEKTVTYRKPR